MVLCPLRLLAALLVWLTFAASATATPSALDQALKAGAASPSGPQRTERIEAELVPMSAWAAPGSTAVVAVRQQIQPGWHTYWRNPGDSGGPTTLDWTLPAGVKAGDIVRAAQNVDKKLITDVTVFDVYEGKGIDSDKKSIAIAVTIQPREKTMTDQEIDAVAAKVVAEVTKKTGGTLRA